MDAGVAGVVAMRYNVYVVTAAQFVADLYADARPRPDARRRGHDGPQATAANPDRSIAYDPRPLQDWCVPVVYESMPIRLFPSQKKADGLTITILTGGATPAAPAARVDSTSARARCGLLRPRRDATGPRPGLRHPAVSCCCTPTPAAARPPPRPSSPAGIPRPAASPARCSSPRSSNTSRCPGCSTGSARSSVRALEQSGVHWLALDDASDANCAADALKQVPVLWIWDNVEPIAGFPRDALGLERRGAAGAGRLPPRRPRTQAKFLLTSRRDEQRLAGQPAAADPGPADADAGAGATGPGPGREARPPDRRRGRLETAAAVHRGQPPDASPCWSARSYATG